MKYHNVPLGEVADFINGRAFKPEEWENKGLPIIRIQNLTGSTNITNYFSGEFDLKYLVVKNDLLISWSASLGVYLWNGSDAIVNQHIFKVVPHKGVDKYYLYFAATYILDEMASKVHGSTMQHITREPFETSLVPLPPLPEQQRIAAILQKADRLRRLRRYACQLSDSYLQSVFLEMFGDPGTNPKGWDRIALGEKITFLTSGSRGWAEYYSIGGDYFLRIQNVGKGKLLLDDLAHVHAPDSAESRRTQVKSGDLLLSITADLGRTAVIPLSFPKAFINQHLALIRLEGLNPVFVSGYINTPGGQGLVKQLDKAGVKSGLNFDDINSLKIFLPPDSLQSKFEYISKQHEEYESRLIEAERQAEHLFQSLLQQAFQGK